MSNPPDPTAPFSMSEILAAASSETGLKDFGPESHIEALRVLVDSTNRDITLTPLGTMAFKAEVHRMLVNRLRFADDLKRYPEILDEDVSDPIMVIGLPRTGTTKLQRMMAADPDTQPLHYWRLLNPAPFPNAVAGQEDPRIEVARQTMAMMVQLAPGFMASHPTFADQPDEETFLQLFSFRSVLNYLLHPAHSYYQWLLKQSQRDTYVYMKQLLQYLQWQDGGKRGRPWVLKSPVHTENMDLIAELFPQATIAFTHRSYYDTIPSYCRLMEMSWGIKTENVDPLAVGRMGVKQWSDATRKHLEQREALGTQLNIVDVTYEQIKDDPLTAIRRIYGRAGRELTPQREQAMLKWSADNPQGQFGSYSYSLENYGLTRADIDAAFGGFEPRFKALEIYSNPSD